MVNLSSTNICNISQSTAKALCFTKILDRCLTLVVLILLEYAETG